eukprot:TRINITY_DN9776_c0_g1_i1.p3 TRINITY_DN9776_c0_g1~~TRINITY_DN9776_c0_g1_i1.p3  ORF type:complete len:116 (+),score=1.09 TRINITY_DN9776_c0_g1_i1:75-422(+)
MLVGPFPNPIKSKQMECGPGREDYGCSLMGSDPSETRRRCTSRLHRDGVPRVIEHAAKIPNAVDILGLRVGCRVNRFHNDVGGRCDGRIQLPQHPRPLAPPLVLLCIRQVDRWAI